MYAINWVAALFGYNNIASNIFGARIIQHHSLFESINHCCNHDVGTPEFKYTTLKIAAFVFVTYKKSNPNKRVIYIYIYIYIYISCYLYEWYWKHTSIVASWNKCVINLHPGIDLFSICMAITHITQTFQQSYLVYSFSTKGKPLCFKTDVESYVIEDVPS